jgi:acetyl-CoA C-acetyltransferase
MGNVVSAGLGQNAARQAALRGGLASSVGATMANKVCCGGLEGMSRAPSVLACAGIPVRIGGGCTSLRRSATSLLGDLGFE